MTLSPPTFTDGDLLSAYALNTLSECTNQIQGASVATSSIFVTRTTNSTWYMRRRFRYLCMWPIASLCKLHLISM